jgi:hypothetical protein
MLAGPPGDRKSTTIDLPELIARKCLPSEAFLPKAFSPETLFDEYDIESGGKPDKLLICDDANPVLADWQKAHNGERNAAQFLQLYDCKGLSESYRRNRKEGEAKTQRRFIPRTSTSVVFGATLNICMFRNQATRAGLQRRFLYYVAERHGRVLLYPPERSTDLQKLVEVFLRLGKLAGPFTFSRQARELLEKFQYDNRARLNQTDSLEEALRSRLSSAPTQTFKVAMIFEACRSASSRSSSLEIQAPTLRLAIDHVEECLRAAASLDLIAHRIYIANDAEWLLAHIRLDFRTKAKNGSIILSRTDLTSKYANHGSRGLSVNDLYQRLVPYLIERRQAKALPKEGKLERYAFRTQD